MRITNPGYLFIQILFFTIVSCRSDYSIRDYIADTPAKKFENYSFDKTLPIADRVDSSDQKVLEYIRNTDRNPDYTFYEISEEEKLLLGSYINQLPALYQQILKNRLIAVYFINNLHGSGLTDFVLSENDDLYTILFINPVVFEQTISQLVTSKDNSCFREDDTNTELDIKVSGNYSGLMYILMHESTHIVDYVLKKTPYVHPAMRELHMAGNDKSVFVRQFWTDYGDPEDFLMLSFREQLNFYSKDDDSKISNSEMLKIYREMSESPFTSLYSTLNWAEDYAEYATFYYFTRILNLDYRITITDNDRAVLTYEPFANRMVSDRQAYLDVFD